MLEKVQLHVGAAVAGSKRPAPDPPASTRADPFKIPYREFCTLADLSPQHCTLAASDLPNAASSDTLSAPGDEIFDMTSEIELDTSWEAEAWSEAIAESGGLLKVSDMASVQQIKAAIGHDNALLSGSGVL